MSLYTHTHTRKQKHFDRAARAAAEVAAVFVVVVVQGGGGGDAVEEATVLCVRKTRTHPRALEAARSGRSQCVCTCV